MAPYAQWGLHAGTPLHETGDEFAFGLAPNRDVFAIKQRNTGSRSTEVHVLSAESSYQQFALQTGTVLHETGDEFAFLLADNRDLVAVKKRNTGSGSTEVHVVSAAHNYQRFSLQTATALHETGGEFAFAWAANRDLVAIKKQNTGSGSTEVHILSAASNYQQFAVQTGTPLHETGDEFAFLVAENRDLVVVKKRNTGTNSTEVHILSAASNYQQFVLQTRTGLHETGDEFAFLLAANGDLFAVKKQNTGTRSTEIHVLLREEETQSRDEAGECVLLPGELALSAVHAALLRTGRLLFFSYDPPQENNTSVGKWLLWDPATGPVTPVARDIGRNLFCAGHCFLADGRLLVAGGHSNNVPPFIGQGADHDIHVFDPVAESWTRLENMPAARYYPTCVTLPGGNGLIASGAANRYIPTFQNIPNDDYEVFDWRRNVRTPPARFNPGHMVELYPFMQVIPDGSPQGRLLVFSKNEARLFSLDSGTWDPTRFRTQSPGSRTYPHQGACVLLPILPEEPNRIRVMVIGGEGVDNSATNTAEIFDFDSARPMAASWRDPAGGHMRHGRFMADAVLLPDATVLVVNGAGGGVADHSHDPVLQAELFDPATETWRPMASINRQRMYHSTAILLPTAEVLIGGNTEHWNPANPVEDKTLELFHPPYLFRGARPKISQAPQAIAYGESFDIVTPQPSVARVALLRCGSVTHTNNMDQRYVGLSIQRRETDRLTVVAPPNGTVAPPGFYLLFIVTGEGIPSIGYMVHLDPTRVALAQPLIIDHWFTVNESDASVDTGIDAVPTDLIAFEASGDIWAGVWATGRNGPNGWNNVDHDPKFPLHTGADAHRLALIGRYGDADYFFIGTRRDRAATPIAQPSRLFLRTNDDWPGNGDGAFNCRVQVWRRASSDFDVEFYVTQHGDLASAFGANYTAAFDHWINQGLPNEGRRGSIEFDVRFYLERYGDLRNAFSTDYRAALDHWLQQGLPNEGRRGSVEFDVQFYLNQYGDLRNAFGTDYRAAAEHWLHQGLPVEGRRGSREFDVQFYLKRYPDLRAAFGTRYRAALDHWSRQGLPNEFRRGSREFDVQFYLSKYSDLRAAFGADYRAAMSHWVNQGCRNEGRAGAREFDVSYYLTNYGDLAAAFGANREAALDHWIMQGLPYEGRRASLDVDVQYYLATYTDLHAAFGHDYTLAFDHWVIAGISEGRNGAP